MMKKAKKPEIRINGYDGLWDNRKLSDEFGDFIVPMRDKPKEFGGSIPWTRIEDITGRFLNGSLSGQYVSEETVKDMNLKIIPKDSLIVSSSATFGVVAIVTQDLITNQTFIGLVPKDKSCIDYWYSYFHSNEARNYMKLQSAGSTIFYIARECFENMPISLPQRNEMHQIGTYFKNLDGLIDLHQKEIDRMVCVRKAMLEKMFPQGDSDVPAVRFKNYNKPWKLCPFSEIFIERHIIDTISDEYPQLAFTIEEGVIRPEDKKTNKRDFLIIDKATKKYLQTEYDDIIYNPANVIYGAIHRNALGKGCVSPIYKIFSTNQDSTFMECIVRHPRFIKEISRSMEGTVKKLRTLKPKAFLEMSAYIAPTIDEQKQIGDFFKQIDRLIEVEKQELEKIKHIKSACLDKMFV